MSWLDKIAKKRLEELEAHPELNSDKFGEKMSTLYFAVVLLIVAILILLFWYDIEELPTLLKFDIVHVDDNTDTDLLESIRKDGVVLYEKN